MANWNGMGTKGVETRRIEVIKEPMNTEARSGQPASIYYVQTGKQTSMDTEALGVTGVYISRSFGVDKTWIQGEI